MTRDTSGMSIFFCLQWEHLIDTFFCRDVLCIECYRFGQRDNNNCKNAETYLRLHAMRISLKASLTVRAATPK